MAESRRRVSNLKMSILLKKDILEKRRIGHLLGLAHFTIPLKRNEMLSSLI